MTEKYPDIKIRFRVHKWFESEATAIFNENAEPYVTQRNLTISSKCCKCEKVANFYNELRYEDKDIDRIYYGAGCFVTGLGYDKE